MRCATHPSTETYLRCGRCGTPICPRCLVMTPVGARCRSCSQLRKLPTFVVGPREYALALLAGLGVALAAAIVDSFIGGLPFISLLFAPAVGYLAGEAISRSVNRKRGRGLRVIAGASVVFADVAAPITTLVLRIGPSSVSLRLVARLSLATLVGSIANPLILILLIVGIWIAVNRIG